MHQFSAMPQPSGLWPAGEMRPSASGGGLAAAHSGGSGSGHLSAGADPDISTEGRAVLKHSGSLPHFGFGLQPSGSRFGSQSTGNQTGGTGHTRSSNTVGGGGGGGGVSVSGMHQGAGLRLAFPDDDDDEGMSACHSTMTGQRRQRESGRPENSLNDGSGLRVSIGGTVYLGGELIVTASGAHINGVPASTLKPTDFVEDGRILGKGVSGQVRRMLHRATGERIAVKEIALGKSDIAMQNVKRELRTLFLAKQRGTGLSGPQAVRRGAAYLVDFFGAWANQGSVFIAMECMDGSLGDFPGVPCPERVAGRMTAQIVRGLKFLHEEAFLVHRDLKPPNILFSRRGLAKITDFGLTAQLDGDGRTTNSFVGSVMYMSPERLRGETYSLSADVWAFGITIAEVVLGFHPFRAAVSGGHGQQDTFWKLLELYNNECAEAHRMVREAAAVAKLSNAFLDFVLQCIQPDQAQRPACSDLLFHPWITGGDAGASTASALDPMADASHEVLPGSPGLQPFAPLGSGGAGGALYASMQGTDADGDFRGFSSDDEDDDDDGPPDPANQSTTFRQSMTASTAPAGVPVMSLSTMPAAPAGPSAATLAADSVVAAWLTEITAASASTRSARPGYGEGSMLIPEQE